MRGIAASLFALMVGLILAPAILVVEFHADRDRIARELCVQRDVVEDMRTCHGECQLSKRLRALEHEANAPFPMERLESRFEPQVPVGDVLRLVPPTPQRALAELNGQPASRCGRGYSLALPFLSGRLIPLEP
ncbi:MAG: hypothetical protein MUE88_09460 [Flavobacteriales bacterium]|nr:hypothetical protein [Flavobacteriales bacterium]